MTTVTGAARNYSEHRPRYPGRLIDDIRTRAIGEHGEHLVDWGCGTGELTLPLSPFFDRVMAVDASEEMISVARDNARREGVEDIEWLVGRAEDLELACESCDLLVCGSAFHWMDRELLAGRAFRALRAGAMLALAAGAGRGLWKGTAEWRELVVPCLEKHIRARPEGGSRSYDAAKAHADFLALAGFRVERLDYLTKHTIGPDEIVGYLYSISFALPGLLGDGREDFESEVRDAVARGKGSPGVLHETINFNLTLATKPG